MTSAPVRAALAVIAAGLFVALVTMNRALAAPRARSPILVVLFTPPTPDPLVARIEAELAAVHIAVRILDVPPESEIHAIVTSEISSGASAAIRVLPRSSGTEVWTKDTTAQVLRRRSISGADTSDAATSVVAWRTVEFLRASLLDLGKHPTAAPTKKNANDTGLTREATTTEKAVPIPSQPMAAVPPTGTVRPPSATPGPAPIATPAPSSAPAPAPLATPAPTPISISTRAPASASASEPIPPPTRESPSLPAPFALAAGPAIVASFGGIGPIASGVVVGRARIAGRSGIEVMALFPIASSRLTTSEGSVQIGASLFGAGANFRLTPPGGWVADCAVGASALLFRTVGTGVGTNQGSTDSTWRFATYVRLGAGFDVASWLTLRTDVIAGASSRLVVSAADSSNPSLSRDLATWGPTFAAATVTLQARW